jgi:uncharacterized protein (DUF488 family)
MLRHQEDLYGRNVLIGLIASMEQALFTIGYANRLLDDFIALLKQHAITALCDVRSSPYSSRNPQYNRELLKQSMKLQNIEYVFLGEELGARSKDTSCYVEGKAVYQRRAQIGKALAEKEQLS